jgi:hypothetical protein
VINYPGGPPKTSVFRKPLCSNQKKYDKNNSMVTSLYVNTECKEENMGKMAFCEEYGASYW